MSRVVHVDHLTPLIDGAVHASPHPGRPDVGLIDEPAITDTVTARLRRFDHEWHEALHHPVDRDVIDLDIARRRAALPVYTTAQQMVQDPIDAALVDAR